MNLMIVESPNKIKKIKSILDGLGSLFKGVRWEVAASVGHIRDLPLNELGIAMPEYRPQYELTERGGDVIKRLKALAAKADEVYLATDPDREGEAIAWHLKEALHLPSYQRVAFDAITPAVITRALAQPRRIDDHLVQAQEARRVLDRLVGYQVSPVLSRQTARRGLSAGRVQSPAVRLIVDREREIEAFVETRHFGAEVSFDGNSWRAQWDTAPFLPKGEKYLMDQALAERAARCREFRVEGSENRLAPQAPPPPFTTSTLLQAASVSLGLKPDVTAQLAQRLFEAGLITYHRTDSQNFSAEALKEVRAFAGERKLPLPPAARRWKARGGAQEAHEAIRPTHFPTEGAGEDRLQQAVYRLIWMRAVASQLADAVYSVNTLRLVAEGEAGLAPEVAGIESSDPAAAGKPAAAIGKAAAATGKPGKRFVFKAVGRTMVTAGWKALTAKDDAEEDEPAREGGDNDSCGKVPLLPVGATPRAESGRVLRKKTQPPSRYTQASLIKKLESIGIGRPSTYPAILKNVLTRGYLSENAKFLVPTELGCVVVDALQPRFRFLDYAFTRDLEQQLDDIAEGKAQYRDVVAGADAQLQAELVKLSGGRMPWKPTPVYAGRGAGTAPGGVVRAASPSGSVGAASATASVATRKRAAAVVPKRSGAAPAKRARVKKAASLDAEAPAVKATRRRSAPAGAETGNAHTRASAGASSTGDSEAPAVKANGPGPATLRCPRCKEGTMQLSRDEKFYGCSRYREGNCGCTIYTIIAGRRTKPADLAALCAHGRTGKLTGFISKTGRPFEATLVINEAGKVEFSFAPR